jgi:hypothetical protein
MPCGKKGKLKTYVTRIPGVRMSFKSRAFSKDNALKQVWADIKNGYRYGITSLTDLRNKAKVERIS